MADLVVIEFPTEAKAEEVRQKLLAMQQDYIIDIKDAVIAVKQPGGHIKLNQLYSTTAVGAASGAVWGTLVGLIFLMPLVGTAVGAASGAVAGALTDAGINDNFMKQVAATIDSGSAALFVLIRKVTADKVLEDLRGVGGKVIRTSFSNEQEEKLREALAAVGTAATAEASHPDSAPIVAPTPPVAAS